MQHRDDIPADLEWLARNVSEWALYDCDYISKQESGHGACYHDSRDARLSVDKPGIYAKRDWLQARQLLGLDPADGERWSEWIDWNRQNAFPAGLPRETEVQFTACDDPDLAISSFMAGDLEWKNIIAYRYRIDNTETPEEKEEFDRIEARARHSWEASVPESVRDMVNHPPHYTRGGIECIDAIRAALTPEEFRGYCKGNALKYVWRELHKGGDESMRKANWYINQATESSALRAGELGE